jgi:cellulose biosynthesis protein BcsQ
MQKELNVMNTTNTVNKTQTNLLTKLNSFSNASNYEARIPRKLAEAICNVSTSTLIKLEKEGLIIPVTKKHGKVPVITYSINEIQRIFKYKNVSFKNKTEAEIISIFSQKGGVGKSAFTQHMASILSLMGKVLIVDLDAQSDATVLMGLDANYGDLQQEDDLDPTIAELMDWTLSDGEEGPYDRLEFEDVVKKVSENIDVIPADLELGEINYSLNRLPLKSRTNESGEKEAPQLHMIKEVLDKVKDKYDYILIDCPPNIETCNVSALFACNRIIIPLELEAKSLTTMRRNALFLEKLKTFNNGFNWDKVLVVPNKFRQEIIKTKAYIALGDKYGDHHLVTLSEALITNSSIIDKCSDWKTPIYSPSHRYNGTANSAIPQAMEFTDLFWGIAHEILDLDLEYLIFNKQAGL